MDSIKRFYKLHLIFLLSQLTIDLFSSFALFLLNDTSTGPRPRINRPRMPIFGWPFECSAGHRDSLIQIISQLVSIAHYEAMNIAF